MAYIGQDGTLHAISQNGASDSRASAAGGALPLVEQSSYAVFSAGTSPDGHYFAYSSDQTYIINLAVHNVPALPLASLAYAPSALCWSPDSKRLAIDDASQGWSIIDVVTDQAMPVPGSVAAQAELLGWIDATHLLGLTGHVGDSTRALLSLDVSSGAQRTIATVSTGSLSNPIFVLSPDGKQVLLYNIVGGEGSTIPYRPFVAVINTATGQQQPLPKIAQITNGGFESVAWKPGTETVAVSGPWLLDLARDTAIHLPGDQFPLGWAPDTGALVLSDLRDLQDEALPGGGNSAFGSAASDQHHAFALGGATGAGAGGLCAALRWLCAHRLMPSYDHETLAELLELDRERGLTNQVSPMDQEVCPRWETCIKNGTRSSSRISQSKSDGKGLSFFRSRCFSRGLTSCERVEKEQRSCPLLTRAFYRPSSQRCRTQPECRGTM